MKSLLATLLSFAVIWFSTACSLASPSTQSITIVPSHPNAEVVVDGQSRGTGTMALELKKNRGHSVLARCGNSSGVATLERNMSSSGVLDMIGGLFLLVPFIGLTSPGAWELSPSTVSVPVPDASGCE